MVETKRKNDRQPPAVRGGRAHADLWSEVEELGRIVARRADNMDEAQRRVRFLFATVDNLKDNEVPTMEQLLAAKDAFYFGLPFEVQQKILAGWLPFFDRPGRRELAAALEENSALARVMLLSVSGHSGEAIACHDFEFVQDTCPVSVIVREGTSKRDVVEELWKILGKLDTEWEELIADPFLHTMSVRCYGTKQKAASEPSENPQPSSKGIVRAEEPSAALTT